ncbi:MAG: derlin [Asgard group archaeon]|nr:derlin [Asgard group archaeon]
MANNTIVDNIQRIPPVTRFFTIASVITCISIVGGFFPVSRLLYTYFDLKTDFIHIHYVIKNKGFTEIISTIFLVVVNFYKFTTLLLIPESIFSQRYQALIDIYFFYTFSNHLEIFGGKFNGNFPDYLWYAIICGTLTNVLGLLSEALFVEASVFPFDCLLACVTYTWARCNKNATINLMGIVPIKAYYLPLGNLVIKFIALGPSGLTNAIIGITVGYLYLCIQLSTMPLYNLMSGAYGQNGNGTKNDDSRRVGILTYVDTSNRFGGSHAEFIDDSIYDKGYLKAPKVLYDFLKYPINTSVRKTAFTSIDSQARRTTLQSQQRGSATTTSTGTKRADSTTGSSTGYSWFGGNNQAFKGKGRRLGD